VNNRPMADMGFLRKSHRSPRKHMNSTILLHVAVVLNDYLPPVPTQCTSGPDIDIFPNDYVASHDRLRVDECTWMNDRFIPLEFIKHNPQILSSCLQSHSFDNCRKTLPQTDTHRDQRIALAGLDQFIRSSI